MQPELLAAGRYTLRLWRGPGLGLFPVKGRTDQAIGSLWGSERDKGARRHEGVDIFAPRGTPAVAATDGYITRTGESKLGGLVVWLADNQGQNLYYAHLDKQLVQPGQRVRAGDTLGLVGNTGNARTTAPHLHFGIYRGGRGAVDPWPFLHREDPIPTPSPGPTAGASGCARARPRPPGSCPLPCPCGCWASAPIGCAWSCPTASGATWPPAP
ncbi:MAG: peptidoglycan DD-metalloendopeptidase family protein [Hymenobacter sp.]